MELLNTCSKQHELNLLIMKYLKDIRFSNDLNTFNEYIGNPNQGLLEIPTFLCFILSFSILVLSFYLIFSYRRYYDSTLLFSVMHLYYMGSGTLKHTQMFC